MNNYKCFIIQTRIEEVSMDVPIHRRVNKITLDKINQLEFGNASQIHITKLHEESLQNVFFDNENL